MTKPSCIKPITRTLCAAVMLSGLSGCTTINKTLDKYAPAMSVPDIDAQSGDIGAPSSWAFGASNDQAIADSWDQIINDAQLLGLIDEALERNRSLQASFETIARSRAILAEAKTNQRPVFGWNFAPSYSSPLENAELSQRYSGGLNASWEADLWGRIEQDIAGAEFDLEGAKSFYENARQSLIAQVARAYISAIEARLQEQLTQATLDAQLETLRVVDARYEFGAASKREHVLAASDVAGARDTLEVARADLRANIRALQVLLGRYPDGSMTVPNSFPSVQTAVYSGQPSDILRRRPDILTAEYDVRSAFANENVTRARTWPSLSLSADISSSVSELLNLLDPADIALSVGARLADELFDTGADEPLVLAAQASSRQALRNYGQSVLDAYADVEDALDTITLLNQRYQYVDQAAQAARETLRLAEIQYKAGDLELLDVLTFRQRSFQADRTSLSIQRQQIDARILLYLALGGGV